MVWDQEVIDQLRQLWTEGHGTAEIGRRLGVSKNAIVGKAHRLDLDGRPSPIRRPAPGQPPAAVHYPRLQPPPLPPLASLMAPPARVLMLPPPRPVAAIAQAIAMTVSEPPAQPPPTHQRRPAPSCCWPIGEPGTPAFRFCDDLSELGKSYCSEHNKLAYVHVRTSRKYDEDRHARSG